MSFMVTLLEITVCTVICFTVPFLSFLKSIVNSFFFLSIYHCCFSDYCSIQF